MSLSKYNVEIKFNSYIADPYWPEMNDVINIQTKSGMKRARSEDKAQANLLAYLKKLDMSEAEYHRLEAIANHPWYRSTPHDATSQIIIPRHQFSGMLVQGCKSAPAGAKFKPDDLRSKILVSDFTTGKLQADGLFRRYVKNDKTNMRRLQEDEHLVDFTAKGTVTIDPSLVKVESFKTLLIHCLTFVGVGTARKMSYGRGELVSMEENV